MKKLNDRLQTIYNMLEGAQTVADIGSDHGLIPAYVAKSGRRAIVTDFNSRPLDVARLNLKARLSAEEFGLLSFREGYGLEPLEAGEADAAVIAGMGGELIIAILDQNKEKTKSIGRFVLQPRTKVDELRKYLMYNKYKIIKQEQPKEHRRPCDVLLVSV
jgi:tRNA (adenine22-N1)-methyltransferase